MADDEYEFGPLRRDDPEAISDLITRMDGGRGEQRLRDKSAAYYRWMYLDNPAGQAVVHSARLGDKVVASFAVAPKIIQIEGRRVIVGKTMDMFTDPGHQGRGLIKRCTAAVFAGARDAGIAGWYVTPSVNSYPIFRDRWGYVEDFSLAYRTRVLRWGPVLAAFLRPRPVARLVGAVLGRLPRLVPRRRRAPRGTTVELLESFDSEADRLWDSVAPGYRVAMVRDSEYLNWRYVANPDRYTCLALRRGGRLVGIVVLTETIRRGVRVGEVVDLVCPAGGDTLRLLLRVALTHFRREGVALVQAWSIPGTGLDRRLRGAGLRLRRGHVKFLVSPNFPEPAVHDPEAWFITQGDGNDV